jgi:hypothetical protein
MVFCGDLPEADCDLLKASQEAMSGLTSASTQLDMSLSISNIPDAPFENLAFSVTGDGAFAIDPALQDQMMAMKSDPTIFANPAESMALIGDLIGGVSGDLNLTLTIPAELAAMASAEMEQPLPVVDGFGYVNLDSLAAVLPPDAGVPAGWVGIDLATALEMAMEQADMLGSMEAMDPSAMEGYMSMFQDPAAMGEFMTIERLSDTEVAGQAAAVFLVNFDYGAFFQSEMFSSLMQAQMDAISSASGEEMSSEEFDEMMGMLGPMFENLNLEITETIGLEDNYTHTVDIHLDWDMAEFMAMVEPDSEGAAPVFVFDMSIQNADFNAAPEITAPEDATIFPIESMFGAAS